MEFKGWSEKPVGEVGSARLTEIPKAKVKLEGK